MKVPCWITMLSGAACAAMLPAAVAAGDWFWSGICAAGVWWNLAVLITGEKA